jgi:hypothetical protein
MRILHFSGLHIGVENYGRVDPHTGLSTRLLDFLAALDVGWPRSHLVSPEAPCSGNILPPR